MQPEHFQVLLKEYDRVHDHWMEATRHKAIVLQATATIIAAVIGAHLIESNKYQLDAVSLCCVVLAIVWLGAMAYTQKEAEYWVAALCLESIERYVQSSTGFELLSYVHRFKDILFDRRKLLLSKSPIRRLQIARSLPVVAGLVYCGWQLGEEQSKNHAWLWVAGYIAIIFTLVGLMLYPRKPVLQLAQTAARERFENLCRETALPETIKDWFGEADSGEDQAPAWKKPFRWLRDRGRLLSPYVWRLPLLRSLKKQLGKPGGETPHAAGVGGSRPRA